MFLLGPFGHRSLFLGARFSTKTDTLTNMYSETLARLAAKRRDNEERNMLSSLSARATGALDTDGGRFFLREYEYKYIYLCVSFCKKEEGVVRSFYAPCKSPICYL